MTLSNLDVFLAFLGALRVWFTIFLWVKTAREFELPSPNIMSSIVDKNIFVCKSIAVVSFDKDWVYIIDFISSKTNWFYQYNSPHDFLLIFVSSLDQAYHRIHSQYIFGVHTEESTWRASYEGHQGVLAVFWFRIIGSFLCRPLIVSFVLMSKFWHV